MINLIIITKRSVLVILLLTTAYPQVSAQTFQEESTRVNQEEHVNVLHNITNVLVEKGLNADIAEKKVQQLFTQQADAHHILKKLCTHEVLELSSQKLYAELAHAALFEEKIDLQEYKTVATLVQKTKLMPLSEKQKNVLRDITAVKS